MHPMLNIAIRAARVAGNIIAKGFENQSELMVEAKGSNDFVTRIDKEAEQAIISKIQQSFPEHSFVGEEGGVVEGDNDFKWIIRVKKQFVGFVRKLVGYLITLIIQSER